MVDDMKKMVKFEVKTGWHVGWLHLDTMEIELPSGYKLPVENGYVTYLGETVPVLDIDGNPIV
jgi:hypothetical protein